MLLLLHLNLAMTIEMLLIDSSMVLQAATSIANILMRGER